MQRPNMADLFTANGSSTGSNWVASNIANIGYNWSKWHPWEGGYEIWFSRWYITKDSYGFHKPYVAMAVYPNTGSGQYWESYIGYDNNTKKLKFTGPTGSNPQDTPASWSIGGNVNENPNNTSGQVSWTDGWREDYNFSPYEKVLLSGNGQAFSNSSHWEQIVHYVERQETNSASSIGCEWIRTRANIKPQNAVSYIKSGKDSNTAGTIKNDTLKVSVDFDWNGTGNPTDYKIEFTASGVSTITKYQSASVRRYDAGWDRYHMEIPITEFTPDKDYSITITPIVRIKDNFNNWHEYYYSNVSKTTNNFVRRDPRPSATGLTIALKKNNDSVSGTSFGIVKDYDLTSKKFTINYVDSNSGGRANSCIVRLWSNGTDPALFFPNYGSTHSLPYSDQIAMNKISVPFTTQYYRMEVEIWHSSTPSYTTTVVVPTSREFISSQVRPTFGVKDLQCSTNNGSTWSAKGTLPSTIDSDTIKFKWAFDGATNGTLGLANTVLIRISDKDHSSTVYKKVWCGATNDVTTGNSTKSIDTSLRTPPTECTVKVSDLGPALIGVPLKLEITPYFLYDYYYDSTPPYVDGTKTYTLTTDTEINLGLNEIKRVSPISDTSIWFKGNVAENELPQFRIAFELPEDINYKYLNQTQKNNYRYSNLTVSYVGNSGTSDTRVYNISDNMTDPENPTWICVTGDGQLRYKATVIIDLTGINVSVDDTSFTITISVTSQYGSTRTSIYTINVIDFPLILAEDPGGIVSGTVIEATSFNGYFTCKETVDTFLKPSDVTTISRPVQYEPIKYDNLKSLINPINTLQSYTSGSEWSGNLKVYSMPRAISKNGSISSDVPFYQKSLDEVFDHIYTIGNTHTDLTQLSTMPSDYSDKYNKYFQQDKDYTFRSTDNNVPIVGVGEDLPLYSATEYNVLWSYYLLYRRLHTNTLLLDWYLKQTTANYTDVDSQSHGGWISISDIQLDSNYTYELDADLLPGTALALREWTAFGGSYTKLTYYEGLFCYIGNGDGLLHLSATGGTLDASTPITIEAGRTTYRFEPTTDLNYIRSTVYSYNSTDYQAYSSYIYVPIDLYTDYTYEITANVLSHGGRIYSVLGGSTATGRTFIGANGDTFYDFANGTLLETMTRVEGDHTYIFNGNGSHTLCADGGFFLMAVRDYQTGERILGSYNNCDSFFEASGRVIEVKIKDGNGDLIMDFVPESNNGNFGFRDKLSDTFYAAADNSKFLVSTHIRTTNGFMIFAPKDYSLQDGKILGSYYGLDSLYGTYGKIYGLNIYDGSELIHEFVPHNNETYIGMIDKVTGVFYPCNNDSKFYMLKEGQEPLQLNMMLGVSPDDSEDESEDIPDGEE